MTIPFCAFKGMSPGFPGRQKKKREITCAQVPMAVSDAQPQPMMQMQPMMGGMHEGGSKLSASAPEFVPGGAMYGCSDSITDGTVRS